MRLFAVWNRSYKVALVVAEDIDAALNLAHDKGHLRRGPEGYRKHRDLTDAIPSDTPEIAHGLLRDNSPGVVTQLPSGEWKLS